MKQGKSAEKMDKILDRLLTCGATHFKFEEDNYDRFGYLQTAAHKKEHAELVEKIRTFKGEMNSGKTGLSLEVMKFICEWLSNHIMAVDQKHSEFFNKHGLK